MEKDSQLEKMLLKNQSEKKFKTEVNPPRPSEIGTPVKPPPVSNLIQDIDSGQAFQDLIDKYTARIRQLKAKVSAFEKENSEIVDETLLKNLELIVANQTLEQKVKDRTQELESANTKLELKTRQLVELGETKESLLHMIVHDMKNPLTAILGTLRLFSKNSYHVDPEIHDLLKASNNHGQKLLGMIEEILLIGRMQTSEFQLKPASVNLISLIRQCVDLMAQTLPESKTCTFAFNPPQEELIVLLDCQLIERVLNNLINNAIKYAPAGTEILVETEMQAETVMVSVTNWGAPIPKSYHQRIFELFCRVNPEDKQLSGTGIGLTFVKLAIEAHGGKIEVISPVLPKDLGVCFRFHLPLQPKSAT